LEAMICTFPSCNKRTLQKLSTMMLLPCHLPAQADGCCRRLPAAWILCTTQNPKEKKTILSEVGNFVTICQSPCVCFPASCCDQAGPSTLDMRTVVGLSAKGRFVFDGICECSTSLTSCTWVDNCDDGGYVSRACLHVAAASMFPFFRRLPNQLLHTWENPPPQWVGPRTASYEDGLLVETEEVQQISTILT
jgi:hypothetical protein